MRKLLLLFILLLISSCRTVHEITPGVEAKITTLIKDTTIYIYIPGQKIKQFVEIEVEKDIYTEPSIIKGNYATSVAYIHRSTLFHELDEHEQEIRETIPEAIREVTRERVETVPVEVNILTWWQQLWIRVGKFLSAVTAGVVVVLLIRMRLKSIF